MRTSKKKYELFRILAFMEKRVGIYFFALLINYGIIAFTYNIMIALVLKDIFNGAIQGNLALIIQALKIVGVSTLLSVIAKPVFNYIMKRNIKKTMFTIRVKLVSHLQDLPVSFFEKYHSGDILSRLSNDVATIEDVYSSQIGNVIYAIMFGIGSIIIMFSINWLLSLIAISIGLLSIFINTLFAKPVRILNDQIQQQWGILTGRFTDLLAGFQVMKIFHIEELTAQRYRKTQSQLISTVLKNAYVNTSLSTINFILDSAKSIGLIVVGGLMVIRGKLDMGSLIAIYELQDYAAFMFRNLGDFIVQLQHSLAGAGRVFEILDEPAENNKNIISLVDSETSSDTILEIQKLNFYYIPDKPVIRDLDLKVKKGQIVALVGPSGGGKSTIIKLLMGFYPLQNSCIFVNGKSIAEIPVTELRKMFAYVSQEPFLFDTTIEENIRYGRPDATPEEVIDAAKAANAHEFIIKEPLGYHFMVGQSGHRLSGGQKQRISIARAFIKNAPIIILDEATSALDSENEQLIQKGIDLLVKGRTVLIIAHRLSTVEKADLILVVDKGKIIEQGNHQSLLHQGGLYSTLYYSQFLRREVG